MSVPGSDRYGYIPGRSRRMTRPDLTTVTQICLDPRRLTDSSSFCNSYFSFSSHFCEGVTVRVLIVHHGGGLCFAVGELLERGTCLRGCQSTDEPEASEGESSRTGHSRLNLNSHKRQIVVSNVTKYFPKHKLII